jgi:hypothetical protein
MATSVLITAHQHFPHILRRLTYVAVTASPLTYESTGPPLPLVMQSGAAQQITKSYQKHIRV